MDVYLRSNDNKPELLSLRSQSDKVLTSVEPNNLILSSIVLNNATPSKAAKLSDIILNNIVLSKTTGRALETAKPTDLKLSSIILNHTRNTSGEISPAGITIEMSVAETTINMEVC